MTPDVNVLVAAFRRDHAHHLAAKSWLAESLAGSGPGAPLRLLPPVVAGFLRIVTNTRVFVQADNIENAVAFIDALLGAPDVEITVVGEEWPHLRRLCLDGKLAGNAVPDAWLAAAVVQLGEHLVTFDAGLRKLLKRAQVTLLPTS